MMKKVFSFLFTALLAVGIATATDVEFDFTSIYSSTTTGSKKLTADTSGVVTITYDKGTSRSNPSYYASGTSIRIYGGNTFTIASSGTNITKVTITRANAAANALTASTGTFTDEGSGGTSTYTDVEWTGSATSVVFTVGGTSGNARLRKIVVTLEEGEVDVKAPVISPNGGTFTGSQEVTITCETEGASIYYTTDGTDPTASSTAYTAAFTLTESATVKAIAIKGSAQSSITSATFTATPSVSTIKEAEALDAKTTFVFNGEVTVMYVNGKYTWIKDASGSGLIYGSIDQTYEQGQIIPAGWSATNTVYYNVPEFESPSGFSASTKSVDEIDYNYYDPAEVTTANVNEYLMVKNCTMNSNFSAINYTNSEGTTTSIPVYDKFKITKPTYNADSTYDVVAIVTIYRSAVEFYPVSITTYVPADESNEAYVLVATETPSLDPTAYTQMTLNEEKNYFEANNVEVKNVMSGNGYFGITTVLGETIEAMAEDMLGFESNGYEVTNYVGNSFDEATGVPVSPGVSNAAKVTAGVYNIYLYSLASSAIAPKSMLAEDASMYVKVVLAEESGINDLTNVSSIDNVKYYNMAGVESNEPMDGVNIRVITFTDGSKAIDKVIR